jgi:hypothetical protein
VEAKVMKKQIIIYGIVALFICLGLSGCEWLDDSNSECDLTKADAINVGVQPIIHYYLYSEDALSWDYAIDCTIYKVPCGASGAGYNRFDYDCISGENEWSPTTAGAWYYLWNTKDKVVIETRVWKSQTVTGNIEVTQNIQSFSYSQLSAYTGSALPVHIYL